MSLQRFPPMHTGSLETFEGLQSALNSPVTCELLETGARFEWQADRIMVGGVAISSSQYGAAVRGRAPLIDLYAVVIPLHRGGSVMQSDRVTLLSPGKWAAVVSPSLPGVFEFDSGYRGLQVAIPTVMVSASFRALSGRATTSLLRFEPALDLSTGRGAELLRLLQFILAEAEFQTSALTTPLVARQMADALVLALVSGLPHDHSHLLQPSARAAEPRYVARVEAFIEADLGRSITIADLARIAGVSGRAIQAGFQAHRGCSPMAFVRTRRFELARRRLQAARADTTIAEVAMACGFEHLGRFAAGYRARFGEGPKDTVRCARREGV